MGDFLFHAHSGLRYLVLLTGAAAILWAIVGMAGRRQVDAASRRLRAAFVGTLDLQVVLGLLLLVAGGFNAVLIGHIVLVLLAVVLAHATSVLARRRTEAGRPPYLVTAVGFAASLTAVVFGILAIGRDVV